MMLPRLKLVLFLVLFLCAAAVVTLQSCSFVLLLRDRTDKSLFHSEQPRLTALYTGPKEESNKYLLLSCRVRENLNYLVVICQTSVNVRNSHQASGTECGCVEASELLCRQTQGRTLGCSPSCSSGGWWSRGLGPDVGARRCAAGFEQRKELRAPSCSTTVHSAEERRCCFYWGRFLFLWRFILVKLYFLVFAAKSNDAEINNK